MKRITDEIQHLSMGLASTKLMKQNVGLLLLFVTQSVSLYSRFRESPPVALFQ